MTVLARILLPFPVSVNALYRRGAKKRVINSKPYADWKKEAGWELLRQRPVKISGPVTVRLSFTAPDNRRRDADNLCKSVLDLLVMHRVIEDDGQAIVRSALPEWVEAGEAPCVVTIERAA